MKYFKPAAIIAVCIPFFIASCSHDGNYRNIKQLSPKSELSEKKKSTDQIIKDEELIATADTAAASPGPQKEENDKPVPQGKTDIPEPKADWNKKIIKTATVKLELNDYKKYNEQVRLSVKQFGGYIATEEQTQSEYQIENIVTIKVPVDKFEEAMNALPGNEAKVMERRITSEDVTSEYVDIKSRLASRKQVLAKYLEFLRQSKNMEEMLQVQNEINEIQENIESAAGRAQYLSHSAAFSTINLTYYQLLNGATSTDDSASFFNKIVNAFKNGLQWVSELTIAITSIWPFMVIIIGVYVWFKKVRKPKAKVL